MKTIRTASLEFFDINDLKDITQINIDERKPVMERILHVMAQLSDPYSFRVGTTPVKVVFLSQYANRGIEVGLEKIVRRKVQ